MSLEQEYQRTKEQLQNIPKDIKGKKRADLRQRLKRKIKEYEYSTAYERFEPSPHIPYFINRNTNEKTLHSIIRTASSTDEFTIDTESINIRGKGNVPALVQLQIIIPNRPSVIMIIEMHHLPREDRPEFLLIKELFKMVFLQEKTSYIFGSNDELIPFTRFKLFTIEQVKSMKFIDLQKNFKRFWNEQHPHQQINSTNDSSNNKCMCERCIGKDPSNSWSLQDCTAYQLNQYLPKIYSESPFDIGLDPTLYRRNSMELEHRKNLSDYAFNDCLSMEIIIRQMKMQRFKFNYDEQINKQSGLIELSPISSNDDDDDDIFADTRIKTNRTVLITNENNNQKRNFDEHEEISFNKKKQTNSFNTNQAQNALPNEQHIIGQTVDQLGVNRTELTELEKKKIHNRTCTIKQRQRCYRNEIIRQDIDNRFSATSIKKILKDLNIPVTLVNKFTSRITNKTTLFIGIKDPTHMDIYERVTSKLFSTGHFREFIRTRRQTHRHEDQRQTQQRTHRQEHRYENQRQTQQSTHRQEYRYEDQQSHEYRRQDSHEYRRQDSHEHRQQDSHEHRQQNQRRIEHNRRHH